jgi:hypothetical protein
VERHNLVVKSLMFSTFCLKKDCSHYGIKVLCQESGANFQQGLNVSTYLPSWKVSVYRTQIAQLYMVSEKGFKKY